MTIAKLKAHWFTLVILILLVAGCSRWGSTWSKQRTGSRPFTWPRHYDPTSS